MLVPFFHVGIVVPDLYQAKRDLSSSLGLSWGRERPVDMPVSIDGVTKQLKSTAVYSIEGPPYVELLVRSSLPPWDVSEGLHHMGIWSEDVSADIDALVADKYELKATSVNPDGSYANGLAMLVGGPTGVMVELVDSRRRRPLENFLAGGDYE